MRPLILAAALLVGLTAAEPAPADGFTVAVWRAPALRAAVMRSLAAERAIAGAGVLPDPMVGADVGRERPREGEDMTMYGAMIEQPLPRWGERDASRLGARAQAAMARAELAERAGALAADVATALAEAEAAAASATLVAASLQRMRSLGDSVRAQVASGGAMIGTALAVETRVQQLEVQLAGFVQRQSDATSEVRGLLGLADDVPVPAAAWPDPAQVSERTLPMVQRAEAERAEAEAMTREATARGNPESSVGLAWERESAGTEMQTDKVSLIVRMSLPVWRSSYAASADAARTRARAAMHDADASARMARAAVARAARAVEQAGRAQAAADATAARAGSELDAVIRQVGSGGARFAEGIDLLERISEAHMQAIEARMNGRIAQAALWRLAPPGPPPAESTP